MVETGVLVATDSRESERAKKDLSSPLMLDRMLMFKKSLFAVSRA